MEKIDFARKITRRMNKILLGRIKSNVRYIAVGYTNDFKKIKIMIAVQDEITQEDNNLFREISKELSIKMKGIYVDYYIERADFPNQVSDNFKFENKLPVFDKYEDQI